jgi:hypothetical protein
MESVSLFRMSLRRATDDMLMGGETGVIQPSELPEAGFQSSWTRSCQRDLSFGRFSLQLTQLPSLWGRCLMRLTRNLL